MTASGGAIAASPRGRPHLGPRTVVTAALWPGLQRRVDTAPGGCTVRVHPAVAAELVTRACTQALPRAVFNARVIAELLESAATVTTAIGQEGLPLAM